MAQVQKVIITDYPDGSRVMSNIRNKKGVPVFKENDTYTATRVTTWYDGTPMDDSKADGRVYLKHTSSGEYYRVNLPNDGELFLEKDTVEDMRSMSSTEILLLRMGYYKGVTLSGYYEKQDTPTSIDYILSDTVESEDGGSVFEVGGIKLEHEFVGIVNSKYFGLRTLTSPAEQNPTIQKIIDKASVIKGEAYFPEGFYYINGRYNPNSVGIRVNGEVTIRGEVGTIFKVLPQENANYSAFSMRRVSNVSIDRLTILGEKEEHTGEGGEWGMGIDLRQCDNIKLTNLNIRDCWGDGIYLGKGDLGGTNNNVLIENVNIGNCRRQGVSVITSNDLFIKNIEIDGVMGASPEFGVDIEPNHLEDVLININIDNIRTRNCEGGGILVNLNKLSEAPDPVSINVHNHYSLNDTRGFQASGVANLGNIKGFINYNNNFIHQSKFSAVALRNYTENAPLLTIGGILIIDSGTNHDEETEDKYASGIQIYRESSDTNINKLGNIVIENPVIIDTRETPLIKKGIYVNDLTSAAAVNINSVKLINPKLVNVPNITWRAEGGVDDPLGNLKWLTTGLNVVTNGISFASIYSNLGATSTTTSTLSRYKNSPSFTFLVESPFNLRVTMTSGSLGNYLAPNEYLQSNEVGAKIVVRCVNEETNEWVLESMQGRWINIAKGESWESGAKEIGDASLEDKGVVNQTAASADTATEAAGATPTKEEFDALLAELRDLKTKARTAGILANS